jgi:hypothetical protein
LLVLRWFFGRVLIRGMLATLTPVNSSAIAAVGFDGRTLYVQFHTSDTVYGHHGCPYTLFEEFINASSMGAFYNQHIRGKFQ